MIREQQDQIEQLRKTLDAQSKMLDTLSAGQNAGTAAVPSTGAALVAAAAPAETISARVETLSKDVQGIKSQLGGFRFSGDFRYRYDLQLRSGNEFAGPLQNSRGRYRVRLNVDKDLAKGLTTHLQLSTGPLNNEITNDQDFAGVALKHPFSIAEAWMKYSGKNFTVRGGRIEEVFADNARFLWDDDVRLNGFDARYNVRLSESSNLEFRAGEYILTNPNTPVVPAGSPYLAIGYQLGQKVRAATLFHPGFVLRTKAAAWNHQLYGDYSWYRNAGQIQLASTTNGFPVLASSAIGLSLSGPLTASGNAVTTPGGAQLAARHWQIAHGGYRADYGDFKIGKKSMPFWADFQTAVNTGTGSNRTAFMASANVGAIRKFGDTRYLYQFSYKQANAIISQFTDDDLGTGTGVNTRVHALRFDLGLTRFMQWQNLLFIQDPIASNHAGFFVTVPKGANTTFRYLGQLAFTF